MPGTASTESVPSMPCAYPTTDIHSPNIGSIRSIPPVSPGAHPASPSPAPGLASGAGDHPITIVASELIHDLALPAGYKWIFYYGCDLNQTGATREPIRRESGHESALKMAYENRAVDTPSFASGRRS